MARIQMQQVLNHIELVHESLDPMKGNIQEAAWLTDQWFKQGIINDEQASLMHAQLSKARETIETLEAN